LSKTKRKLRNLFFDERTPLFNNDDVAEPLQERLDVPTIERPGDRQLENRDSSIQAEILQRLLHVLKRQPAGDEKQLVAAGHFNEPVQAQPPNRLTQSFITVGK